MSNTEVNFQCKGHCFGTGNCSYAQLFWKDGEVISVRCGLPKKIGDNIWLWEIPTYESFGDWHINLSIGETK